jgi:hypothetical protein
VATAFGGGTHGVHDAPQVLVLLELTHMPLHA